MPCTTYRTRPVGTSGMFFLKKKGYARERIANIDDIIGLQYRITFIVFLDRRIDNEHFSQTQFG